MVILWAFLVLLGIILIILMWVLFSRIIILIDTANNQYHFRIPLLFRLEMVFEGKKTGIRIKILGISKKIIPLAMGEGKSGKKTMAVGKILRKGKYSFHRLLRIMPLYLKKIIRSFRVKECRINIDTGDFSLNSYLIPVMFFFRKGGFEVNINYHEYNSFYLLIHNRPARLIWIGLGLYWQMRMAKVRT